MKNNKIVWQKKDSDITWLTFWKEPFPCGRCGKETRLTSHGDYGDEPGVSHPLCKECYEELHAYHLAVLTSLQMKGDFIGFEKPAG